MSRSSLVCLFVLVASLLAVRPASAEVGWNLALKSDGDLLAQLTTLEAEAPGGVSAPAVQLLREAGWEVLPGSRLLYRNIVMLVNDPDAVADLASSFYLDARGSIESALAFHVRDGKISRPEVTLDRGDGQVKRSRLGIALADLEAGDVVGMSTITRFDGILYFDTVPMNARVPVAQFSLRVRCENSHTYKIQAAGPTAIDLATVDYIEGRPIEWHATAAGIAAMPDMAYGGIYEPGMSLALVAESSEFVPAANSWVTTLAWQRVALFLAGLRESGLASMTGARDRAAAITASAATDTAKRDAIFAYVRDEFELLRGAPYEPLGYRDANAVLESGQANPMEKILLMITLLDAAGLRGDVAVVRTEDWGPLGQNMQSFVQFHELAVRCGPDASQLYVPYVAESSPGSLPEAWGSCWVLAPSPGLLEKVYQASAEVMSTPNVDVHAAFLQVRERAAEEGWFMLEQVGGGAH